MTTPGDLSARLLACPFCGGRAKTKLPYVRCTECGGQMCFGDDVNDSESAIAAWNRRAALSALPAAGGEVAAWQYRFIDPEEGPGGWLTIDEQHVALMRGKKSCEVRALGVITTPQPSAAEVPSPLGDWHEPAIAAVGAQGEDDIGSPDFWTDTFRRLAAPAAVGAQEDGEGLTGKQAWWAGARAGLGLPADTPRTEVAAALAAARVTPAAGKGVGFVECPICKGWHEAALTRQPVAGDGASR